MLSARQLFLQLENRSVFSFYAGDMVDRDQQVGRWEASINHRELKSLGATGGESWLAHDFCSSSSQAAGSVLVTETHVYCFDGSIDYRSDLQQRLGRTGSDTDSNVELFAQAYRRWGEACLEHVLGDFAGAVWDRKHRTLWAFTDHCARIKLYWSQLPAGVVVSTYLPAVLATDGCKPTLDGVALASTAIALAVRPGHTAFDHIKFVVSGHALHWQPDRSPYLRPWYVLPEQRPTSHQMSEDQKHEFVGAFRDAVNTRIPNSGPVAGTLSGGLDSTLVIGHAADLLADSQRCLYAYTAVPHPKLTPQRRPRWDANDWRYAANLATRYGNVVHAAVSAGEESMIRQFRRQHELLASPVRNGANHQWMLAIAKAASERKAEVLLTGQRGNQTVSQSRSRELLSIALRARDYQALRDLVTLRAKAGPRAWFGAARRVLRKRSSRADERRTYLAGYLAKYPFHRSCSLHGAVEGAANDVVEHGWTFGHCHMLQRAMCFATDLRVTNGISMRDPTTDRRMLEVLFRLPPISGLWHGLDRGVARWAGEGVVPDEIRGRTTRGEQVPEEAGLPSLFRDEYDGAWASVRKGPLGEIFDIKDLDQRFRTVMGGHGSRTDAAFMHRFLDIGLFMAHVDKTWGPVELAWTQNDAG